MFSDARVTRIFIGGVGLFVSLVIFGIAGLGCSKKKTPPDAGSSQSAGTVDRTPSQPVSGAIPPTPSPPQPRINFDLSRLGYDPYKPDETIPIVDLPRKWHAGPRMPMSLNGKVIATEGQIYGISGSMDLVKPGEAARYFQVRFNLLDKAGKFLDASQKILNLSVGLAQGQDWHNYRPGQVVKVVGRGKVLNSRSELNLQDSVVLSVSGKGDEAVTADQLSTALQQNRILYTGYSLLARDVIVTAVLSEVRKLEPGSTVAYVKLSSSTHEVLCTIWNKDEFLASNPQRGDPVTIMGKVVGPAKSWGLDGLYISGK